MRARASGRTAGFKTSKVVLELLGGSEDYTRESYGFIKKGKGIASTYGVSEVREYSLDETVLHTFCLPEVGQSVLFMMSGRAYRTSNTKGMLFTYCDFSGDRQWMITTHASYQGNPVMQYTIFTNSGGFALTKNGQLRRFSPFVPVGCALRHMDRVFFVDSLDRYHIIWSTRDCTDPIVEIDTTVGLEKGGSMKISPEAGEIDCLYGMGNDIIIVCKYGIKVMHAMSDARHFSVERSMTNSFIKPFYPDAGVVCRGKLWLGTYEGLYVFDGKTLEHVELDCCSGDPCCTFIRAHNERFIDILIRANDHNTYVLEYDIDTGHSVKFAKGSTSFLRAEDEFFTFYYKKVKFVAEGKPDSSYFWETRPLFAEEDGLKLVKNVTFDGVGDFKVTVASERGSRTVEGNGSHQVGVYGRSFTFKVEGCGELKSLKAAVEVRK